MTPSRRVAKRGRIFIIAGTNGAGKSRLAGDYFARENGAYYNPDIRTGELVAAGLDLPDANAQSWREGYDALRRAIDRGESFTLETTLGGNSICQELHRAAKAGQDVRIAYLGLTSPELHIERVRARVARGGHDIPEPKIRERYTRSLHNLISLIGVASELYVFDNSAETDDGSPNVRRVLQMKGNRITWPGVDELLATPEWAKPIVAVALRVHAEDEVKGRAPRRKKKG
jgi:predicted ABC-type ATPase